MKKIVTLVLALMLTVAIGSSYAQTPTPSSFEVIYSDPDTTIKVEVGQEFTIALDENPSTGYLWEAQIDTSFLELVESKYEAPSGGGLGAPGTRSFVFAALKEGNTEVTMTLTPPGEEEPVETKVFTVEVAVEEVSVESVTWGAIKVLYR
jgi:inhibitor of cysteine peptidase